MSDLVHKDYDKEPADLDELLNRLVDAVLEVCAVHQSERVRFCGHEAHRARDTYMNAKKRAPVVSRADKGEK